jgi:hypothetical protein
MRNRLQHEAHSILSVLGQLLALHPNPRHIALTADAYRLFCVFQYNSGFGKGDENPDHKSDQKAKANHNNK